MESIENQLRKTAAELSASFAKSRTLKHINKTIDILDESLYRKGYTALFHMRGQGSDKLSEHLKKHVLVAIANPLSNLLPAVVETITRMPDQKGDFVKAKFHVDYDTLKGAHVTEMEIYRMNPRVNEPLMYVGFRVHNRKDIPTAKRANLKVEINAGATKKRRSLKR